MGSSRMVLPIFVSFVGLYFPLSRNNKPTQGGFMSDAILSRLESIENSLRQTADRDRPLNFNEAAQYLTCSKSYLYKLTHRRLIPCFKPLGKKLFFKRQDLECFLLQKPIKTSKEIEQAAINRIVLKKS